MKAKILNQPLKFFLHKNFVAKNDFYRNTVILKLHIKYFQAVFNIKIKKIAIIFVLVLKNYANI